jgi:hypothetical protein
MVRAAEMAGLVIVCDNSERLRVPPVVRFHYDLRNQVVVEVGDRLFAVGGANVALVWSFHASPVAVVVVIIRR